MANPRSIVRFLETAYKDLTFLADGVTIVYDGTKANGAASTIIGKAAMLSADDTVALTQDASHVLGEIRRVEADGMVVVRIWGYVVLPAGASATVTVGLPIVGAVGAASARGYVRVAASATAAEVLASRGFIQNNDVTTKLLVFLG